MRLWRWLHEPVEVSRYVYFVLWLLLIENLADAEFMRWLF